ncbi:hypothetical protein [Acidovorax sp. A1169]|uniref:hypothetical protein n=1 Tax=Acidovorax sp. A1169 TaxID=3059524 RepID=UPI0027379EEE|nr:hypothetical protein [Acidovorax sp. A1169]MDP4076261.1 hypothetical protein [Acidovorax sp. A1169]
MNDSIDQATAESIARQFTEGADRMTRIEDDLSSVRAELKTNTEATQAVASNTAELVEMFQAMKGAFKVFNWIGSLAKPMAYVIGLGTAIVGMWAAIKTGIHPK